MALPGEPVRTLRLGHTHDSDDAFMFYALTSGLLDTGNVRFEHELQDLETLNQWAVEGRLEITAISLHGYAFVADRYALLTHGASMGDNYGPIVVARDALPAGGLKGARIAVPGLRTTAFLTLRLFEPDFEALVLPFDRIMEAVLQGQAQAGLLIHEGQLTHARLGLHTVVDLGAWWYRQTSGLPLPLGVNVVRRDLGSDLITRVSGWLEQSVRYALAHRRPALEHAMVYARGMEQPLADRFVGMYVNELTVDMGDRGRRGVQLLLERARAAGLLPTLPDLHFVG